MKKLIILTGTRAEYGLLAPIIKKIAANKIIDVRVAVTGSHLSPEFGMTVREIERDGIDIDKKIEILMSSDSAVGISKAMGLAIISFAEYFEEEKPDALMVLGDRYESLAVCIAAMNGRIPIIHLHGGEATEGLIDESIRNAITKLSFLHFTSTESYRKRVVQMGENPERVFNVGAMGVENVLNTLLYTRDELEIFFGFSLKKIAILTFHPVTLENQTAERQIQALMEAVKSYHQITFICTKANADINGRIINKCIQYYSTKYSNIKLYDSLGMKRYLSILKYASFVIGNSSSGLIEVPSYHIPTINIGDRQKGRIQADSIINCSPSVNSIRDGIEKALSEKYRERLKDMKNPYGDGKTSDKVVKITLEFLMNNKMNLQKKFYDI